MFLSKDELKTVSTEELINKIINNDIDIVNEITFECIDVMSSYLADKYNVAQLFSATGNNRSKTVLKHLKAMVIYEIYARRSRTFNEVAKQRYDEAILWLEAVANNKINPPLPPKLIDANKDGVPDAGATFLKLGSNPKYKNHW